MKQTVLAVLLTVMTLAVQAQTKNFIDRPYIEVTGSADTLVTPNLVYLHITLSEKDNRDRVSLEELEQKMVNSLKEIGVDTEKDLFASDMISNYRQYLFRGREILKSKTYSLRVPDAVTATRVFMKLEEAGISQTYVERVEHTGLHLIQTMMMSRAIMNARAKVNAITAPLQQMAGPAILVSETQSADHLLQGRVSGIQIRGNRSVGYDTNNPPSIEFEKIRVSVQIRATFVLQ